MPKQAVETLFDNALRINHIYISLSTCRDWMCHLHSCSLPGSFFGVHHWHQSAIVKHDLSFLHCEDAHGILNSDLHTLDLHWYFVTLAAYILESFNSHD